VRRWTISSALAQNQMHALCFQMLVCVIALNAECLSCSCALSAECKLSASFLECTQCQMLSDLAVFTSNRECAKHCVWCGYKLI